MQVSFAVSDVQQSQDRDNPPPTRIGRVVFMADTPVLNERLRATCPVARGQQTFPLSDSQRGGYIFATSILALHRYHSSMASLGVVADNYNRSADGGVLTALVENR